MLTRPLVVATASPNRRAILQEAGLVFDVAESHVDESVQPDENPEDYVRRLAEAKARSISGKPDDALILTADTCIDIGGTILGKPRDEADARVMLKCLSGRWHEVWGGIALRDDRAQKIDVRSKVTKVKFSQLSDEMIDWYVATGEPMGRAGSYAIQGHGRTLVESVDGCFTNVIGISLPLVFSLLGDVPHLATL